MKRGAAVWLLLGVATGCAEAPAEEPSADQGEVRIDTSTPQARAQYDASVEFVKNYRPTCTTRRRAGVKRVLVSGFGRFMSNTDNATGRIVSALSGLPYPESEAPAYGEVDPLAPQLAVGLSQQSWPQSGPVELCAMILPVVWDVAPLLLLRELSAFEPDLVLMNGIANSVQDLWIELGGVNEAARLRDGSNLLTPYEPSPRGQIPLIEDAPHTHPNRMSWERVQSTALAAWYDEVKRDESFGERLTGVALAGFPRSGNTYLCNNITFVTSYLMDTPGKSVRLLEASEPVEGRANDVVAEAPRSQRQTPRAFLHWPSELLRAEHSQAGARVLRALADAQLSASAKEPPSAGSNAMADPSLRGGETY